MNITMIPYIGEHIIFFRDIFTFITPWVRAGIITYIFIGSRGFGRWSDFLQSLQLSTWECWEMSLSEPHSCAFLNSLPILFSEINFSTSLENLRTSHRDSSLLLAQVIVSWLHSELGKVKEYWLSFLNLIFHLIILTLKGGGFWGKLEITANGFRFLFGVIKCSKTDCGDGCTTLWIH